MESYVVWGSLSKLHQLAPGHPTVRTGQPRSAIQRNVLKHFISPLNFQKIKTGIVTQKIFEMEQNAEWNATTLNIDNAVFAAMVHLANGKR